MSICTPCTKTKPVLYCSDSIYIGDWIAGSGITVQVYWKNTATGRIGNEEVVTGSNGAINVVWVGKMESASYEVWVGTSNGEMNDQDTFYIAGTTTEVSCLSVSFDRVYNSGRNLDVASSTIEIA